MPVAAPLIVAAGTIGGAVIAGKSAKKAASTAAGAQQDATNAQLQLGRESLGQSRDIYNSNLALLNPFVQRGNAAGEAINALLGLTPAQAAAQPTPATNPGSITGPAPGVPASPGLGGTLGGTTAPHTGGFADFFRNLAQSGDQVARPVMDPIAPTGSALATKNGLQGAGSDSGMADPRYAVANTAQPAPAATGAAPAATNALSPQQQAFENFANSAGMQFQLQQGTNALQNSAAARGMLQSGATLKALQNYGQQTALNNYFMPYMGLLGGQQATGAQSGAAVAGVGSNFSNLAAGINGQMGNAIQNGANATSNAALLRGQIAGNTANTIGSALGTLGSSFFQPGSSFGGGGGGGGFSYNPSDPAGFFGGY